MIFGNDAGGIMSPYARDLLHPRRAYWRRQWERAWPIVALILIFVLYAITGRWEQEEYLQERAAFLIEKENADFARNLPEVVFVVSGRTPKEIRDKMQRLEDAAALQRNHLEGMK